MNAAIERKKGTGNKGKDFPVETYASPPLENQTSLQAETFKEKILWIDVQEELEAVEKQRDALPEEKEEWKKERILLKKEMQSLAAKISFALSKFFSESQIEYLLNGTPYTSLVWRWY